MPAIHSALKIKSDITTKASSTPQDRFQVNDGSAAGADLGYGTSYLWLNIARQQGTNTWSTGTDLWNDGGNQQRRSLVYTELNR